jgi:molybdopterin synthase catalytic subunit
MIRVQREDFDLGREYAAFVGDGTTAGAVVSFVGRVRDGEDERIRAIELEHYPAMTEKELGRIEAEARERWPLENVLIVHRYGRLEPGDQIVLVLTASAHRAAAFDAARFLMDWLKTKAPFWKREETADGSRWVEAKTEDDEAAKRWD